MMLQCKHTNVNEIHLLSTRTAHTVFNFACYQSQILNQNDKLSRNLHFQMTMMLNHYRYNEFSKNKPYDLLVLNLNLNWKSSSHYKICTTHMFIPYSIQHVKPLQNTSVHIYNECIMNVLQLVANLCLHKVIVFDRL